MSGILTVLPDVTLQDNGGWTNTGGAGSKLAAVNDSNDATYLASAASTGNIQFGFATAALPSRCIISRITLKIRASQPAGKQSLRAQFSSGADVGVLAPGMVPVQVGFPVPKSSTQDIEVSAYGYFGESETREVLVSGGPRPMLGLKGGVVPAGSVTWTAQTVIDNLVATVYNTDPGGDFRVYKVWIEIEYDEPPTVSSVVLSPSSANLYTLSPTVAWTYLDPETSPQYMFDLEIWKQADTLLSGYTPFGWRSGTDAGESSNPMYIPSRGFVNGGIQYSPIYVASEGGSSTAGVVSPTQSHSLPITLINGESYVVNVRVRDQVYNNQRWSASASSSTITMQALTPPSPPKPVSTLQASQYRIKLDLLGNANVLTDNQSDAETDGSGWENDTNATVAQEAANPLIGTDSIKMTSVAAGDMKARTKHTPVTGTTVPVAPNTTYYGLLHVRRAGATSRNARADLIWYTAEGTEISRTTGKDRPTTQSAYLPYAVIGTSPSNAARVAIVATVLSTAAAGEIFNVDKASITPIGNSQNLLINGSFESGALTTDYWSLFTAGTATGAARAYRDTDTNFPGHGARSCRLTASSLGATTSDIIAAQQNTPGLINASTQYTLTVDVRADVAASGARWYLAIEYFTTTGASAGSATTSTPAVTAGVTTTLSVSGTTPASTAYISVKVGMQGKGSGSAGAVDFRVDEVQLETGAAFTNFSEVQWVRGDTLDSQTLEVERTYDGGTNWYPVPGTPIAMNRTNAQKATIYDTVYSPGKQAIYRSRMSYTDPVTGNQVKSPWSAVTAGVFPTSTKFVLRDATEGDLYTEFQVSSMRESSGEDLGEFWPLGSEEPLHVSSAVRKGRFQIDALVTAAQLDMLVALRKRKKPLVFITDMDGTWYWVRFGDNIGKDWLNNASRKVYSTRKHTIQFELAQTKPASGQPTVMV